MPDKRVSLTEAAELVPERGACLAFGGITLYRRPMAFALALLARHRLGGAPVELTLHSFTCGVEGDLLIAAGMVHRTRTCYFGLEVFGLAPYFTAAAARQEIEVIEETEASLAYGLRAALAGVGFMPSRAWLGTDLHRLRPDVRMVVDPYSGVELTAFPALEIDVAVVHALAADYDGNAQIGGNQGVDRELSLVARTVIVTAEKVVPRLEQADLLGPSVTAVVQAPQGAWPTSCYPEYPFDGPAILAYTEAAGTDALPALLAAWIERHGAGAGSHPILTAHPRR